MTEYGQQLPVKSRSIPKSPSVPAEELRRARFATLNSRAVSDAARRLVDNVVARVTTWEVDERKRKNKRRDKRAKAFRQVLEGFVGDLLFAWQASDGPWVYRAMHRRGYAEQEISGTDFA